MASGKFRSARDVGIVASPRSAAKRMLRMICFMMILVDLEGKLRRGYYKDFYPRLRHKRWSSSGQFIRRRRVISPEDIQPLTDQINWYDRKSGSFRWLLTHLTLLLATFPPGKESRFRPGCFTS
jgi:hypothetical protein